MPWDLGDETCGTSELGEEACGASGQETRRSLDGFRDGSEEASAFGPMMRVRVTCGGEARSFGLTAVCRAKRQQISRFPHQVVGTTGKELTTLEARMRREEGLACGCAMGGR